MPDIFSRAARCACVDAFIIARTCVRGRKYIQPFIRATGGAEVGGREARTNEFTISSNFLVNRRYTRFREFTADQILIGMKHSGV